MFGKHRQIELVTFTELLEREARDRSVEKRENRREQDKRKNDRAVRGRFVSLASRLISQCW
jgi:hypothetical protein